MADVIWRLERGEGPVVATAIHDGHEVRAEVLRHMVVDEAARLREEDPFTGRWTAIAPTRVVGLRSRFEVDLNRRRDTAVYRTPEDAWGLEVWRDDLPDDIVERSLRGYDAFYSALDELYRALAGRYGRFLVLDLHSYNHRRDGMARPPLDPRKNPQVNVGTGTMSDRGRWARLIERFMDDLAAYDFPGGRLDVRENVRFRGGASAAWTHRAFPDEACVLSLEVKKFFMDEWTGELDAALFDAVGKALGAALAGALAELERA
ncbi:N-formylglutamate amidohydrolase [bacterium]|nr:N-formylglutamate amidohydrolase [bacterium]MBU1072041.1 N-formylglutamate amidohydrolase [bacterium]MBU1675191.1 N-formylglutamate amidohydrolase [bacterium]